MSINADDDGGTEAEDASGDTTSGDGGALDSDAADGSGDASIVCSPSAPCPGTMACAYADHYCGGGDAGTCVEQVDCAGAPTETICGCDGNIYASRCAAVKAGTDSSDTTPARCSTPSNTFRCGDMYCGPGDACSINGNAYSCRPLNGCVLGCACLDILLGCLLGGQCAVEDGHLVIRCN